MPYLGNEPGAITDAFTDTFSGNGSNTGFTLTRASTTNSVFVRIHGVMQRNGTDFTVDGTTLTFTTAPPNASNNVVVQFFTVGSVQEVADNAVTLAKMAHGTDGNLITYDAAGAPAAVATGSSGQVLTSAGAGSPPTFSTAAAGSKGPIQRQSQILVSTATGTTTVPSDDTKPQISEGNEFFTLACTAAASTNILTFDVDVNISSTTNGADMFISIYKGSTVNPIASTMFESDVADFGYKASFHFEQEAGDTSANTYTVRIGGHAGTTGINNIQSGAARRGGGAVTSSFIIEEYSPQS
jgi:hypothetical protein